MRDIQALYDVICADPYDDTIRLVYADALEESGDEVRANYIRESIGLQFPPDDMSDLSKLMTYKERFDKTQKVLDEHNERWILENELVAQHYDFTDHKLIWSRGLPDEIQCHRTHLSKDRDTWVEGIELDMCEWMIKGLPLTKINTGIRPRTIFRNNNRIVGAVWVKQVGLDQDRSGLVPPWLFNAAIEERVNTLKDLKEKQIIGQYDANDNLTTLVFKTVQEAMDCMNVALCKYLRKRVYG